MRLVAIETATELVGVALWDGGVVSEVTHATGRLHAELLAPALEASLSQAGWTLADVDHVACDLGPGLFTGLRVGIATAKALGQGLGRPVIGCSSLDVVAADAQARLSGKGSSTPWVVSVVDARRKEVFAAAYRFTPSGPAQGPADVDPALVAEDRPGPLRPEELVAWLAQLVGDAPDGVVVVGDGALRYREQVAEVDGVDLGLLGDVTSPTPGVLAALAARRLASGAGGVRAELIAPDYRREADATINWTQRIPVTSPEEEGAVASGEAVGKGQ